MNWESLAIIAGVAIATFVTRIGGFTLGERRMPPAFDRFLGWVPVASFAALAVPGLADGAGSFPARLLGAAVAALVVLRFRALPLALAGGLGAFWLAGVVV